MGFSKVVLWIAAVGCLLGGFDQMIGNKFGLGKQFVEGLVNMGPLALAMGGLICLAPTLASVLGPIVAPAFETIGCDPAIFGSILPNDTGGYALAMEMAISQDAGLYSGLIIASMFGSTLTFMIPVGFSVIQKQDAPYYARGILIGLIAVPIGSIIGGFVAGFDAKTVLMNIIPITVMVILICLGLKLIPEKMIRGCEIFGKIIVIITLAGLACAGFEKLSGVSIIPGIAPISDALQVIGDIGVVLMGIMPIIELFLRVSKKIWEKIGQKFDMNAIASAGIVVSFVSPMPFLLMYKDMNGKGKIINAAVVTCSSAAIGDHLGFTGAVAPEYIAPMIIGKVSGALIAFVLALMLSSNVEEYDRKSAEIAEQHRQ